MIINRVSLPIVREDTSPYFLAFAFSALLFVNTVDGKAGTPLRLLIYAFPFIAFMTVMLTQQKAEIQTRAVVSAALICAAALPGWLASGASLATIREILFVLATPASFLLRFQINEKFVKIVSVGICLCVALFIGSGRVTQGEFSLLNSDGAIGESHMAYPAAALTIYFFAVRKMPWSALMLVATVLSFKRGALLALALGLTAYIALGLVPARRIVGLSIIATLAFFMTGLTIALSLSALMPLLEDYLPIGMSVNEALMGREIVNLILLEVLGVAKDYQIAFGFGAGFASELVVSITSLKQPHNDYLRIVVDYGILGFILLAISWLALNSEGRLSCALALLTATLYLSDNTFIYYYHNFIVAAAIIAYRSERDQLAAGEC